MRGLRYTGLCREGLSPTQCEVCWRRGVMQGSVERSVEEVSVVQSVRSSDGEGYCTWKCREEWWTWGQSTTEYGEVW